MIGRDAMTHLHQVYLMTPDIEASTQFCTEALGLEQTYDGDRSVAFDTGTCELKFERDFDEETLAAFGMEPPGDNRGGGAVLVIEVDDIEAAHERAQDAGATVLRTPMETSWDREMFLVQSPAGYVFEVSKPV